MSGFVGMCNLKQDISNEKEIIKQMNLKLSRENEEEKNYCLDKNINFAVSMQKNTNKNEQVISIKLNDVTYTIVHNGKIYNKKEIKEKLIDLGYKFKRKCRCRNLVTRLYRIWKRYIKKIKWCI